MIHVDYPYYINQADGTLPEEEFSRLIQRACAYIQYMTMGRGKWDTDGEKMAACAVVDVYAGAGIKHSGQALKSENNDGYSVTYVTEQQDGETWEDVLARKAYRAARPYLLPTGLMYRGVKR